MLLYQVLSWHLLYMQKCNNKFKIPTLTWNDEFDLPDGSNSVSDIQDYFDYILKWDTHLPKKKLFYLLH